MTDVLFWEILDKQGVYRYAEVALENPFPAGPYPQCPGSFEILTCDNETSEKGAQMWRLSFWALRQGKQIKNWKGKLWTAGCLVLL